MSATRTEWIKAPAADLPFEVDWSAWLGQGETIASKTVTVTGPDNALTVGSTAASTTTAVTARLIGGTVGARYRVTYKVTTSAANIDERSITINVQDR